MATMATIATILCAAGIVALIWGGVQRLKAGRVSRAPFVKTGEAARGIGAGPNGAISVQGQVRCSQPLLAPVTGTPCLYYEVKVVGSWKEDQQTRSKDYIVEKQAALFAVDDGSGHVPVAAAQGGDFEPLEKTFEETKKEGFLADLRNAVGAGKPIRFGRFAFPNPPMSKADRFTCTERVLKVQPQLFVLGKGGDGVIGAPSWTAMILSHRTRAEVLGAAVRTATTCLIGGAAAVGIGVILGIVASLASPRTVEARAVPEPAVEMITAPAARQLAPRAPGSRAAASRRSGQSLP